MQWSGAGSERVWLTLLKETQGQQRVKAVGQKVKSKAGCMAWTRFRPCLKWMEENVSAGMAALSLKFPSADGVEKCPAENTSAHRWSETGKSLWLRSSRGFSSTGPHRPPAQSWLELRGKYELWPATQLCGNFCFFHSYSERL